MQKLHIFLLFVLPSIICTLNSGNRFVVRAEDELDDELVDVETEDSGVTGDAEIEEDLEITTSPNADTRLLFTKPLYLPGVQLNLPGGVPVEFLVGFANKGEDDFVVETLEASFRYPMDFNYFIQNFSAIVYNTVVKPGHDATISYSFVPSDTFAGRPFGLNIALNYRDANGIQYTEAVFNETIHITEVDDGLDGETFFLYVFLAAIVVLLLVLGQQFLGSVGKKRRSTTQRKQVETGTNNANDVDYDWLPAETLKQLQASPNSKIGNKSPKQSPRQRKAKRSVGSDD
ncbi:translocon-associated protein subunit alpha [Culicoides brevitarsis]|uniref:translocon-associated protein subunit alpha n=1 Tax=Culicoides brevitarsis TaxID=469753 RepID=UPI00307B8706